MESLSKHSTANNSLLKIITAVLFVALPFVGFYLGVYYQKNLQPEETSSQELPAVKPANPNNGVVCTQDAKQCPDGNYVSRIPPACEFAPCPGETTTSISVVPTSTVSKDHKTGWLIATDNNNGIRISFPPNWEVGGWFEFPLIGIGDVYTNEYGEKIIGENGYITVEIDDSNYQDSSLAHWFNNKYIKYGNIENDGYAFVNETTVGGTPAVLAKVESELPYESQSSYFVQHNNKIFRIRVMKNNKIGQPLIDQILSTFKFTDQKKSAYCEPKFKVEQGPELTAREAYAQNCYEQATKVGCEKVDIYRASTNNFGNPDGIYDCQWIE